MTEKLCDQIYKKRAQASQIWTVGYLSGAHWLIWVMIRSTRCRQDQFIFPVVQDLLKSIHNPRFCTAEIKTILKNWNITRWFKWPTSDLEKMLKKSPKLPVGLVDHCCRDCWRSHDDRWWVTVDHITTEDCSVFKEHRSLIWLLSRLQIFDLFVSETQDCVSQKQQGWSQVGHSD